MTEDDYRKMANEGFNSWLASLPEDDWREEDWEGSIPIYWDEERKVWVESEKDKST